ncbi:MAG: secretin and TonB N-terminal domain-containing protein [bacterium]|nr:secretin and TonB N-terminal domain-containing protein [bacterium]
MQRNYLKIWGIVGILILFVCTQVFAEVKVNKPEIINEAGKTIITIPVSGDSISFTSNKYNRIVYVDIADAVLIGAAKATIPVSDSVATKVVIAQYQSEPKVVRAVVTLNKWVPFDIKQEEKSIVIAIDNTVEAAAALAPKEELKAEPVKEAKKVAKPAPKAEPVVAKPVVPPAPPPPVVEVKPEPMGLEAKVTLDFTGAELPSVIRILADKSGLNIVAGPEVAGKVTIHLADVTVKEALDTILAVHGFAYEKPSPNVIRIVKVEKPVVAPPLAPEEEVQQITLNYRKTDDMVAMLKSVMPNLNIVPWVDTNAKILLGTGTLVISGSPKDVKKAIELVKKMDKPVKQVMIDARLVNVDLDKIKDLGIDWDLTKTSVIDSGTYSVIGQSMNQAGGLQGGVIIGAISTPTWDINATLKAAVENKTAEVLANPRILALNNTTAKIDITRQNPYVQWSYDAQTNTYIGTVNFDAKTKEGVTLSVTPQITDDGNILLNIIPNQKTKRGEISFPSAGGAPNTVIAIIDERNAEATLLVKDGQTIVIGGLRKNEEIIKENKIPVLGDIPVLGNIFKSKSTTVSNSELMLFVTPYILKEGVQLNAEEKINFDRIDLK